jgi:hypothetical protein
MDAKNYPAAIKEYEAAFALDPNSKDAASGVSATLAATIACCDVVR